MATSGYKRVSRKRVCRVCGKSDWCSYTPDEKITFCARINEGADRVSRTGWGVFYHEKPLFPVEPIPFPRRPPPKDTELAPLEIRNFAYRKLIELSPACREKEIVDGPKGLRARKILDFENYGALPQTQAKRHDLAKEIRCLINQKFPEYVRRQKSGLSGLPGFWLDKTGRAQVWLEKDYLCPMMLIPYRTQDGLVQACQIRFMCRKLTSDSVRYVWLSTPKKSGDVSCGSSLHFAGYDAFSLSKPLLVTEGALKAETAKIFYKEFNVVASAGVACSHEEITTGVSSRIPIVLITFDTDYYENYFVARAMSKLLNLMLASNKADFYNRIKILTWNRKYKGVDDALLKGVPIYRQSLFEWYESLTEKCQNEVGQFLHKGVLTTV